MVHIFKYVAHSYNILLAQSRYVLYLLFLHVMPGPETPRKRSNIDKKKQAFGKITPMIYCSTAYYFH